MRPPRRCTSAEQAAEAGVLASFKRTSAAVIYDDGDDDDADSLDDFSDSDDDEDEDDHPSAASPGSPVANPSPSTTWLLQSRSLSPPSDAHRVVQERRHVRNPIGRRPLWRPRLPPGPVFGQEGIKEGHGRATGVARGGPPRDMRAQRHEKAQALAELQSVRRRRRREALEEEMRRVRPAVAKGRLSSSTRSISQQHSAVSGGTGSELQAEGCTIVLRSCRSCATDKSETMPSGGDR
jgi:hypothetical protein